MRLVAGSVLQAFSFCMFARKYEGATEPSLENIASKCARSNQKARRQRRLDSLRSAVSFELLSQVQFFDDGLVALLRGTLEVIEQTPTGSHELEQTSTGRMIFPKSL